MDVKIKQKIQLSLSTDEEKLNAKMDFNINKIFFNLPVGEKGKIIRIKNVRLILNMAD